MSSAAAADNYRARFRRVLDYIDAHLNDDLSVERLSAVAAFSKHHFHRQFTDFLGIGVYKYIQLKRLRRASMQLAFREQRPIIDIALANGYQGPEAFARAFKKSLGQTPSEFRKQPQWDKWHAIYQPLTELRIQHMNDAYDADRIKIVDFEETRVATLEYRGDPRLIGHAVRKFIEWRRQNRLGPSVSATFNIFHDDPAEADDEGCRVDICASIGGDVKENSQGVVGKTIPGGRCAVLRHVGAEDTLEAAVSYLYAQWLPRSGEELRDFPLFFQRIRFFPDVPEHEAVTDVFLPLR